MKMHRSDRGSALLISVIVVLLSIGIGGAFMAQSLVASREQQNVIEADEALVMCDAGMERTRQALDYYRGADGSGVKWSWDGILTYCSAVSKDPIAIRKDYQSRIKDANFTAYASKAWDTKYWQGSAAVLASKTIPPSGNSNNIPASTDPTTGNVFIGWNQPYHRGAIHVQISNNGGTGDTATHDADGQVLITVTATLPSGIQRQIEGLLTIPPPSSSSTPLTVNGLAAVVSNDVVDSNGNITVDGRDYDYLGTSVVGPGVFGILSTKTIGSGGSSAIGGVGAAPPKKGISAGSISQNTLFKTGYPATPDEVVGAAPGTLKKAAIAAGTYITSDAQFSALLSANGGKLPDHAIIYADYDPSGGSFDIGSGNSKSSILVIHTDSTTSSVKNLHGTFKGLLIGDSINHVNSGTSLTGMVQLLSPTASAGANVFGNGNATIHFSSAVLADLPAATTSSSSSTSGSTLTSYRRTL